MKKLLLLLVSAVGLVYGQINGGPTGPSGVLGATSNGTTAVAVLSPSVVNTPVSTTLTARNLTGAQIVEKGSRWIVVSAPGASAQASASIASEAGVRHVVDCISFGSQSTGAVTAAAASVNIRDGATGAGTVVWVFTGTVGVAAGAGIQTTPEHSICGLNIVGTTATAMTLEFSTLVTNAAQAVSMSGYNIN